MQGIKNKIYVRQEYAGLNTNSVHGQSIGDIIICTNDNSSGIAYGDGYLASGHNDFRKATKEEIAAFGKGIKNIKDIKVEKFRAPKDSIWVRKEEIILFENIHGRKQGDIVKQHKDSNDTMYYNKDNNHDALLNFREASSEEITAFNSGIKNINKMSKLEIKSIFKEGDVLEFISKDPIPTCFKVGEHVTFISYKSNNDIIRAKDNSNTLQGAYAYQFKAISSLKETPIHKFNIGDRIIGNNGASIYNVTKPGVKGTVEAIMENENISIKIDGNNNIYIVEAINFNLIIDPLLIEPETITDTSHNPKYKFQVGDIVKVVKSGHGVGKEVLQNVVTITELGLYFKKNGYKFTPAYGNCENGQVDGFVGEETFELIPKYDLTPKYFIGVDPYINSGTGHSMGFSEIIQHDDSLSSIATKWLETTKEFPKINYDVIPIIYGTSEKDLEVKMPILFKVEKI